jgi:hypothetical protein
MYSSATDTLPQEARVFVTDFQNPSQRGALVADSEKRLSELDTRLNRTGIYVHNVPRDNRSDYEDELASMRSQYNQVLQDL